MRNSITYRSVPVKTASLRFLKHLARRAAVHVGIDIGKNKIFVAVRWSPSRSKRVVYENPWFVENPDELPILVEKLLKIKRHHTLLIGFESTGSYGDPLRQVLFDVGLIVHQVRTKLTHDYAEVFDGVPSQHDGKDAAVIAELLSQGKATLWDFPNSTDEEKEMNYIVIKLIDSHKDLQRHQGRLEGLLSRHWPGVTKILPLTSVTLLKLLKHYGNPSELHADRNAAANIRRFSCGRIKDERLEHIIRCAKSNCGVRQGVWERQHVVDVATAILDIRKSKTCYKKRLGELIGASCVELQRLSKILGVATSAIVWCRIGNPARFHCADAWIKAMGLNLVEKSSGEYQSDVWISKRGDSETRRWLYLAALRWVREPDVKPWYQRKKTRTGDRIRGEETERTGGKAVIAVLRKIMKGAWHAIVHEEPFDLKKLFCEESSKKKDRTVGGKGFRKHNVKPKKLRRSRKGRTSR